MFETSEITLENLSSSYEDDHDATNFFDPTESVFENLDFDIEKDLMYTSKMFESAELMLEKLGSPVQNDDSNKTKFIENAEVIKKTYASYHQEETINLFDIKLSLEDLDLNDVDEQLNRIKIFEVEETLAIADKLPPIDLDEPISSEINDISIENPISNEEELKTTNNISDIELDQISNDEIQENELQETTAEDNINEQVVIKLEEELTENLTTENDEQPKKSEKNEMVLNDTDPNGKENNIQSMLSSVKSRQSLLHEKMVALKASAESLKEQLKIEQQKWKEEVHETKEVVKNLEMRNRLWSYNNVSSNISVLNNYNIFPNSTINVQMEIKKRNYQNWLSEIALECDNQLNRVQESLTALKPLKDMMSKWNFTSSDLPLDYNTNLIYFNEDEVNNQENQEKNEEGSVSSKSIESVE